MKYNVVIFKVVDHKNKVIATFKELENIEVVRRKLEVKHGTNIYFKYDEKK